MQHPRGALCCQATPAIFEPDKQLSGVRYHALTRLLTLSVQASLSKHCRAACRAFALVHTAKPKFGCNSIGVPMVYLTQNGITAAVTDGGSGFVVIDPYQLCYGPSTVPEPPRLPGRLLVVRPELCIHQRRGLFGW